MMHLVVQIVNYKTRDYLIACVRSVADDLAKHHISYTIAIADNASGDDLSDIPTLFPDVDVQIFMRAHNDGFGAGHNFLARKTYGDVRLLLNPDVEIIERDTIVRLLDDLSDGVAVCGPALLMRDGQPQPYDHAESDTVRARLNLFLGKSLWHPGGQKRTCAWVSGAVFCVRDDAFRAVGGFDEKFFLYKEEEDLCLRLRQRGSAIVYDPTIRVRHIGSVVARKDDHMAQSMAYYNAKHLTRLQRLLAKIIGRFV